MRLISVSGIGPKLGITLLSGMSADEMIASIRTNNLARLTLIPGVGRKTAERLVVELRDKVASLSSAELEEELGATAATGGPLATEDSMRSDVLSAALESWLSAKRRRKGGHRRAGRGRRHFSGVDLATKSAQAGKGVG